jgi:hypothetical protein
MGRAPEKVACSGLQIETQHRFGALQRADEARELARDQARDPVSPEQPDLLSLERGIADGLSGREQDFPVHLPVITVTRLCYAYQGIIRYFDRVETVGTVCEPRILEEELLRMSDGGEDTQEWSLSRLPAGQRRQAVAVDASPDEVEADQLESSLS